MKHGNLEAVIKLGIAYLYNEGRKYGPVDNIIAMWALILTLTCAAVTMMCQSCVNVFFEVSVVLLHDYPAICKAHIRQHGGIQGIPHKFQREGLSVYKV